jgi:uncharacterized protein (UPF0548 family)
MTRLLNEADAEELTYAEQRATLAEHLPPGYHHVDEEKIVGRGPDAFARASTGLQTWQAHQIRGVRVFPPDTPPREGATVVVTLGTGLASIVAPCRIIAVVDEPARFGFAYGTLPGHPEQGEESFIATLAEDGLVRFGIKAFSRPGDPLTRVAGPIGRGLQSIATKHYLRALRNFVDQASPG